MLLEVPGLVHSSIPSLVGTAQRQELKADEALYGAHSSPAEHNEDLLDLNISL